jgi:hypothetical protein
MTAELPQSRSNHDTKLQNSRARYHFHLISPQWHSRAQHPPRTGCHERSGASGYAGSIQTPYLNKQLTSDIFGNTIV